MPRSETCPAPRAGDPTTAVRWALAAFAVGLLIAAIVMP
jgi:hypothetical protein